MKMISISECFSADYKEAREKFLRASEKYGLKVESFLNEDHAGLQGEELYLDTARLGGQRAEKLIVLISGTHGAEGFCGSGVQTACLELEHFSKLPANYAVLFVHAVNPYGFSHIRRVNEDNVDVNRNFIDFSKPLPTNSAYSELHPFLLPEAWQGYSREVADKGIQAYIELNGATAFQAAFSGGQYTHPDGIFYGGSEETWSRTTLTRLVVKHSEHAKEVFFFDFHTGLGPYGYGELITLGSDEQVRRTRDWFGDEVTSPNDGTSASASLTGTLGHSLEKAASNAVTSYVALEFGTIPVMDVFKALQADNWLHQQKNVDAQLKSSIRAAVKDAFYPDKDDWKKMIWEQSVEVIKRTEHRL